MLFKGRKMDLHDIDIAIYSGRGSGVDQYKDRKDMKCHLWTHNCLVALGYRPRFVTVKEIADGVLKNYELLVMPGGDATQQFLDLGKDGIKNIRNFVKTGGGYVGICAGAYLAWDVAMLPENYLCPAGLKSLGIGRINFLNVVDRTGSTEGWDESAYVETQGGSRVVFFPTELFTRYEIDCKGENLLVMYAGGPLFESTEGALATYTGKCEKPLLPPVDLRKKMLIGSVAITRNKYGSGRVVLFSFHPELMKETYFLVDRGIKWVSKK